MRFIQIRNAANIAVARLRRLSLDGIHTLLAQLLKVKSGGLIPVLISVALLKSVSKRFSLGWDIQWQGINSADKASGAGGDITVNHNGHSELVCEVTERPIDDLRVISTFNTKIVKTGIINYLFLYTNAVPEHSAFAAAEKYYTQGHEIIFLNIGNWTLTNLATLGSKGREIFLEQLATLIDDKTTPATIKVAWNKIIQSL